MVKKQITLIGFVTLVLLGVFVSYPSKSTSASEQSILVGITGDEDILYGGVFLKGEWLDYHKADKYLLPKAVWNIYNLKGLIGKVETKGKKGPFPTWHGWTATTPKKIEAGNFAVSGAAKTRPVVMKPLPLNNLTYQQITSASLKELRIKVNNPTLRQLFCQDINEDGKNEVILVANSKKELPPDADFEAGDYGLLLFRYIKPDGKVANVPLMHFKCEGVDPSEFEEIKVLAVLDIQGDGKVEVIVSTDSYVGFGFTVYQFDGKTIKEVFNASWSA